MICTSVNKKTQKNAEKKNNDGLGQNLKNGEYGWRQP